MNTDFEAVGDLELSSIVVLERSENKIFTDNLEYRCGTDEQYINTTDCTVKFNAYKGNIIVVMELLISWGK